MKKGKKPSSGKNTGELAKQTASPPSGWTFLTNHTHVLLCVHKNPELTTRQISAMVGITERMVQKIVSELVEAGYLEVIKVGRRNTYQIVLEKPLRHPLESHRRIGDLLDHLKKGST